MIKPTVYETYKLNTHSRRARREEQLCIPLRRRGGRRQSLFVDEWTCLRAGRGSVQSLKHTKTVTELMDGQQRATEYVYFAGKQSSANHATGFLGEMGATQTRFASAATVKLWLNTHYHIHGIRSLEKVNS